ncbi:MAG: NADH-ubiquinone oxidoreductase-F iron-sulfur binding region domain-containing protein [Terracidiphilus sp.]|nr:NADH-ubiquinone oxidoreductase-F iron-sulfur binding region domain-containing protein [Terracidiphilus sp.]
MNQDDLANIAAQTKESENRYDHVIKVCVAAGCLSANADQVKTQLESELKQRGLETCCKVKGVGCMGLCAAGPLVAADTNEKMFQAVTPADASAIIDTVMDDKPAPPAIVMDSQLDFFTGQKKIVLENSGEIDPERIEDYIAADGYEALFHVITKLKPLGVIEQVTKSGLRGRGGAGFPTGLKWTTVYKASGTQKYVICNADEGDPGAFMDRSVLESDPHRVLEGMAIAAYAVGANKGFIYCRAEYPLAVKRLRIAIRQAESNGLLGMNIGDTHFDFKVEIRLGAGAFVCGEETALIASIEGGRGTPRPRPPFPAQSGLWNAPTLINNVETFANIAPIIRRGGEWYASIGTEKSKGTKVFALAGRVNNTGLIEVPMGITLRDIIFKLGGGIPEGRKFKAVQSGGPSGGCVPEQFLDIPVDYDSLASVGSIMGSGGMIVMDETSCMVDVAKFFMDFCMSESCGKCVPCRVGTTQMHNILERISEGRAGSKDLELLHRLTGMVKAASLCGLGQTAPNPTLTTLRYFMDEYRAHIEEGRCPAGICHPVKVVEEAEVGV